MPGSGVVASGLPKRRGTPALISWRPSPSTTADFPLKGSQEPISRIGAMKQAAAQHKLDDPLHRFSCHSQARPVVRR